MTLEQFRSRGRRSADCACAPPGGGGGLSSTTSSCSSRVILGDESDTGCQQKETAQSQGREED